MGKVISTFFLFNFIKILTLQFNYKPICLWYKNNVPIRTF